MSVFGSLYHFEVFQFVFLSLLINKQFVITFKITCFCPTQVTIPNGAYIAFALRAGGDRQMGAMFIPLAVKFLFSVANNTGSTTDHTLQQFGNFSGTLLSNPFPGAPVGWTPAGFAPWFSMQNNTPASPLYGLLRNSNRVGYNLTEMMAINSVITSPSLLGTTGNKTLVEQCKANATIEGCGYLFYLQAYQIRRRTFPSSDTVLLRLLQNINGLFCQSLSSCLNVDTATFNALSIYITDHLLKLAIHVAIDRIDFGPLMTRTVKQISHGYKQTELKIPSLYPSGLPVPGFLPNDNRNSVQPRVKYYTCKHTTRAFQIKGNHEFRMPYCVFLQINILWRIAIWSKKFLIIFFNMINIIQWNLYNLVYYSII